MPATPSSGTTLMIRSGPTARIAQDGVGIYETPTWSIGTEYRHDEQVITVSQDGVSEWLQWSAKSPHTSSASDVLAVSTPTKAGRLKATRWTQVEPGELYSVDSIRLSSSANSRENFKYLVDETPSTLYGKNPTTIEVRLFSMADRQRVERLFGRANERLYLIIWVSGNPGAGQKGVKMEGFVRLGSSSIDFPARGGNITKTLSFTNDGDGFTETDFDGYDFS